MSNTAAALSESLLSKLNSSISGYEIKAEDPSQDDDGWTRELQLRQGIWLGADVKITQKGVGAPVVEVESESKGKTYILYATLGLGLVLGLWAKSFLGIEGRARLVTAGLCLGGLVLAAPVGMIAGKLLGKNHEAENKKLLAQVQAIVSEAQAAQLKGEAAQADAADAGESASAGDAADAGELPPETQADESGENPRARNRDEEAAE